MQDARLQKYKVLASEFDRAITYNNYGTSLSKKEYAKVLTDMCFVYAEKLRANYLIEFALALPNVNLMWTVLAKLNKN